VKKWGAVCSFSLIAIKIKCTYKVMFSSHRIYVSCLPVANSVRNVDPVFTLILSDLTSFVISEPLRRRLANINPPDITPLGSEPPVMARPDETPRT